jgi:hypothetical protein
LVEMTTDDCPQRHLLTVPIPKAMTAAGRQAQHSMPPILRTAIEEGRNAIGAISHNDDLQVRWQESRHLSQNPVNSLPIGSSRHGRVLLPDGPRQRQAAAPIGQTDAEEMDLIRFGAFIDCQDDPARSPEHGRPIQDVCQDWRIARRSLKMRIGERAAQATTDTLRLRGVRQVERVKGRRNLSKDGGTSGKQPGDEQGEAHD